VFNDLNIQYRLEGTYKLIFTRVYFIFVFVQHLYFIISHLFFVSLTKKKKKDFYSFHRGGFIIYFLHTPTKYIKTLYIVPAVYYLFIVIVVFIYLIFLIRKLACE